MKDFSVFRWLLRQLAVCIAPSLTGLVLLATASPAGAQIPSFAAVAPYGSGTSGTGPGQPQGMALVDVNKDGRPDIVTANSSANTVGVLLGQTGGTFATVTTFASGFAGTTSSPQSVALGDVDKDGNLDIVTANYGTSQVGVLLGNGDGTFRTVVTYDSGTGSTPTGVALGDVNADGKLDIITANYGNGKVGVLLGVLGGFNSPVLYTTGTNPQSVALGDVNADGLLDIITANTGSNNMGVLLGSGSGTFGIMTPYNSGGNPQSVTLGDVNADGKLDIVTANTGSTDVGVLLGSGSGTFGAVTTYGTGSNSSQSAALGDVNGDRNLDIITANYGTNTVGVLLGSASGTFSTMPPFALLSGGAPYGMTLGDVNADGEPDVVTTDNNASRVEVLVNTTTPFPVTLNSLSPNNGPIGTSVTLKGINLTGATGVTFNNTAATTFSGVNATTITATVPVGASTGNVTVTTPNGTSNPLIFTITAPNLTVSNAMTIPAGTYNTITVTGTDPGSPGTGIGTLGGNVVINSAVVVQNGGTLNDGGFVFSGAGSFTLAAGGTLGSSSPQGITSSGTSGTVQTSGTRSFSTDASYVYNGTAAQVTGAGLPAEVRNLSITNSFNVGLTQATTVVQVLLLSSTGNLTLGGQILTLRSSTAGTALVVNAGTGIVTGATSTMQRSLNTRFNSGLGYRHYSAPVSGATVANLATAGFTPVLTATYNASATPGTTSPFPNVFAYDQARLTSVTNDLSAFDKGFVVPTSSSPLAIGQGYAVNIGASQLVNFVGTLTTGDQAVSPARNSDATAPDAGWALVGNPYPAPIDFSLIAASDRTGLDGAMYVFESRGQYIGSYRSYANGMGSSPLIGSGQGFFVRVSTGQTSGTLTFHNSHRLTSYGTQVIVKRITTDTRPLVQLELRGATEPADVLYAYAETGATPAFDAQFDAVKLPNTTGLNLASLATSGEALAIDGRPAFTAATVLPLTVGVPAAGTYSLTAMALSNLPAGLDAFLTDNTTGRTVNLSQQPAYAFSVTTAQAAALITGRFAITFAARSVLATTTALTAAEVTLYPNPTHAAFTVLVPAVAGAGLVQATLFNALGQVVRQQAAALPAAGARLVVETADLTAGIYTLRLLVGATTLAKRVVIQ